MSSIHPNLSPWMATCYAQAEHLTHDWMFPCHRSGCHTTLWTEDLSTITEHLKKCAHDSRFVMFYCGCSNVPLIVFHIAVICYQGLNSLIWCPPDVNLCCNIDVFIYDGYGTCVSDKCDYDTRLTPCFIGFSILGYKEGKANGWLITVKVMTMTKTIMTMTTAIAMTQLTITTMTITIIKMIVRMAIVMLMITIMIMIIFHCWACFSTNWQKCFLNLHRSWKIRTGLYGYYRPLHDK